MPTVNAEKSIGKAVFEVITNMFEVAGARALAERLSTSSIIRDYDVAWGRYRAANSVLRGLDTIASEGNVDTATTAKIRQVYEDILTAAKSQIDQVAEQYPEFVETIQEQLGQRLLLVAEHESVEQAALMGMIKQGIAHTILKNQASRIRQLNQENMSACFEIEVTEILKKVPMFQCVSEAEQAFIGSYLRTKTVPRGKAIIRQGNAGDSIFLIARGIANVEVTEGDAVNHVATLYAGDFFGEAALLHGTPRNATTIAATPCSLYELKRQDLDRVCAQHPKIRQMLEEVDRKRATLGTTKD
jgi:CPA1 family monovalent cation:H+ antiporter